MLENLIFVLIKFHRYGTKYNNKIQCKTLESDEIRTNSQLIGFVKDENSWMGVGID